MKNTNLIFRAFLVMAVAVLALNACEKSGPRPESEILKMSMVKCVDATQFSLTFEWDEVEMADLYEVTFNGKIKTQTATSYTATGLAANTTYTIIVRALSDAEGYMDSEEVTSTAKTLGLEDHEPDPSATELVMSEVFCTNETVSSLSFEWDAVENAASYEVVFNNSAAQRQTSTKYTASSLKSNTEYTITVKAIAGSSDYKNSVAVSCTAKTLEQSVTPDPQKTVKYGTWFEMPVINDADGNGVDDSDNNLYYATHICAGGEKAAGGNKMRNYTVCFSGEHHCPMWVAALRHSCTVGNSGRSSYQQDPDIPANIQYSSTSTGGGCNKGHMLGSAERTSSKPTNRQVFYYTNIAPQLSNFNTGGGGWNTLEAFVDNLVPADTLYEVIGCYFKEYTDGYKKKVSPKTISFGSRNDVDMPTMFYYAVLRTKSGNSGKSVKNCSSSELQCVAFVRSHTEDHFGQKVTSKELMSISDLEKLTGFTYFPNVPNAPKSTFTASDWGL